MRLVAIGLDHTKTPAALREAVAMSAERLAEALRRLRSQFPGYEFTILSTCNRVEIYSATDIQHADPALPKLDGIALSEFLADFHGLNPRELQAHISIYNDE